MRLHTYIMILCITILSALMTHINAAEGKDSSKTSYRNCKPVSSSTCEMCSGGKHSGRPGCEKTGKHQLFICQNEDDDDDVSTKETYLSCDRTKADEEYLMLRLQGLCFFLAFFSLRNVKGEKIASESLFDYRKRMAQVSEHSNGSSGSKMQEMIPLTDTIGKDSFGDDLEQGQLGEMKSSEA